MGIEREVTDLTVDELKRARQARAKPIADTSGRWPIAQRQRVPNGSGTPRAIDDSLKRWEPLNPGYLSRQMGHKNAKMFFEVYSKWIDGAANQLEKDKMRRLLARADGAEKLPPNCNPESRRDHDLGPIFT
ncbi:transposase [Bordetella sp. 02P26C-1]|uniref:transposase n=1 Tax=Bordetella sp. 02P26C-1 TaxID=2683195 RepID=UPI0013556950|nr:transposase [Bordetella sp. 02P26C-1]MVW79614.1 transposase [Bordetella sp. 02P26C-1]